MPSYGMAETDQAFIVQQKAVPRDAKERLSQNWLTKYM